MNLRFRNSLCRILLFVVVGVSTLRAAGAQDLYVSCYDGIRRITAGGEVRMFAADKQRLVNCMGLVFDSHGNLFVAVFDTSSVVKITPDGKIEDFASGGLINHPDAVAIDDHDNIYVANNGNDIVKISPQGEVSAFAQSPLLAFASGLAFGQDGNLYAVNPWIGSMVRINAQGRVSAFADGRALHTPCGVAASVRGNLYTMSSTDALKCITQDGNVQTVTSDRALKGAVHLAFAPSGRLYTVSQGCLCRITPDGAVSIIARSLPSNARCLAFGPIPSKLSNHTLLLTQSRPVATF